MRNAAMIGGQMIRTAYTYQRRHATASARSKTRPHVGRREGALFVVTQRPLDPHRFSFREGERASPALNGGRGPAPAPPAAPRLRRGRRTCAGPFAHRRGIGFGLLARFALAA